MRRVLIFLGVVLLAACQGDRVTVNGLRCEWLVNPQGLDSPSPHLSWEIAAGARGVKQTAYHILVASSLEKLHAGEGDLWDSQTVDSDRSVFVPYAGKPLESRAVCYWKVGVTTNQGVSAWSEPAVWSMGLLEAADWQARWTGLDRAFPGDMLEGKTRLAARYFRKEFETPQKPVKATLYLSGLGLYKLYVNGGKIGEQELSPTPTDYTQVVKYNTFDVTDNITKGKNALATTLGNGRFFSMRIDEAGIPSVRHFGFPKMLLQLELEYADGSHQTVVSDDTWKVTAEGPIRANNEFDGEEYDAKKEMPGWNAADFNDAGWLPAELVAAPEGKLEAQTNQNIKVMETVKPVAIKSLDNGVYVIDMGQNMVGWVHMKVKGNRGDRVKLRFSETVSADGSIYLANIRGAEVTDTYVLKGGAVETFEPSFTYHGFRYVEITGFPGTPALEQFEGRVLYDEMETTGTFETSNETINQIYKNAYWGIRGNYRGMPTDCPQRDERMGWLGDRAVGSHGESFVFNNHNLYAKWLDDIEQSQREDGSIPDVAPAYWTFYSDNMTWPGAYLIIANMLYEQYGDREPLTKHYASMKKWLSYMRNKYMMANIMTKDTYGDWCMPPERPELIHSEDPARRTDGTLLGTSFYYRMLYLLQRFAELQDKPDDAKAFAEEAAAIKDAYNRKFFNAKTAQYSNNTVTANLLSLCYGLVPEGYENRVFANIEEKTLTEFNGHVSTGLVGIQWLMRGLSDYGRADLAYRIATNRDYPSWGYMVENGATTIWELWNGNTADPAMNSHNHVMLLGDLLVWCYEYLAGIQNAACRGVACNASTGFERITMRPHLVDELDYVKASYRSVRGKIESHWQKSEDKFTWHITIPANCTATVYFPDAAGKEITESGTTIDKITGIKNISTPGGKTVLEIGSGNYAFEVK
ncbi:MAG: glycoside hydrolase family 78 protein [Prevotellaceae bacterium]|jgi:alpha-L-rhamnosidase|nr:glycoside hydrolase family 78 protein [Prevotellaceae bacterium]